ncbi:unnamed protein product [Darwinula stevensoni]|uniref:Kazal-like domain-containing protein n=1 Tax=Darwinula stevensoni TaxID=69355 RepID=A0A7R8X5Q5_9CRUS|nr:unnamed protein product [Darwinula stevensoni]CAG0880370.1 unnamed protein product [Darwinula stevensoni]
MVHCHYHVVCLICNLMGFLSGSRDLLEQQGCRYKGDCNEGEICKSWKCVSQKEKCREDQKQKNCPCNRSYECAKGLRCIGYRCDDHVDDCDGEDKGSVGCSCSYHDDCKGKDCLSGSCISGKCCGKPEVEPSVCTPECKQGYTCRHGEGKQNECVSDGSCPTPELCDDTFDPVCSKIDGKVFLNTCRMKAYLCQKSVKSFPGYSSSCQSVCPLKIEGPKSTTAKILDLQETELHDGSVVSLTCQMGQMFSNGQISLNYTCCACGIWEKIGAQNDQNLRCVADPCRYEDCHDTGYECEVTVSEDELTPLKAACICKEPKFVVSLPGKKPRCVATWGLLSLHPSMVIQKLSQRESPMDPKRRTSNNPSNGYVQGFSLDETFSHPGDLRGEYTLNVQVSMRVKVAIELFFYGATIRRVHPVEQKPKRLTRTNEPLKLDNYGHDTGVDTSRYMGILKIAARNRQRAARVKPFLTAARNLEHAVAMTASATSAQEKGENSGAIASKIRIAIMV